MAEFSDEILMAYVDGELAEFERVRVDAALRTDPAIEQRLHAFRMTRDHLKVAFNDVLFAPIPGRLIETVRRAPMSGRGATARLNLGERLQDVFDFSGLRESFTLGRVVAASAMVLAVVFGGNVLLKSGSGSRPGALDLATFAAPGSAAPSRLAMGLEAVASGQEWTAPKKRFTLRPTFTFAAKDGGFCRQFQITNEAGSTAPGVACRTAERAWTVVALGWVKDLSPSGPATEGVTPATGSGDMGVDATVDQMIAGDPVSATEESALLAGGWKKAVQGE